jgi:hypothetical protein
VQSRCVLSEDYFLTDQVIMNPGDMVRPFVRADGTIEALLLSGGVVSHLSRSATAASGWAATEPPPHSSAHPSFPAARPGKITGRRADIRG